ncbi:MAG: mechanosensitive ion channel domain-containing protein [Bacteroidota bacterium]
MEEYKSEIFKTFGVIVVAFLGRLLVNKLTIKARDTFHLQKGRATILRKTITGLISSAAIILIVLIWGVDKKELALFFTSFMAILGIALFAQWSLLSNVTASIILFINHPAKIGDKIVVLDKEFPLTGKIRDIGAFFLILKTDEGEIVTIPNSLILSKMIQIISAEE